MAIKNSQVDRLREIIDAMKVLADEAKSIVHSADDKGTIARFDAYTYPHMIMALDDSHNYVGGVDPNLEKIADALEGEADEAPPICADCGEEMEVKMVESHPGSKTLVEQWVCPSCGGTEIEEDDE